MSRGSEQELSTSASDLRDCRVRMPFLWSLINPSICNQNVYLKKLFFKVTKKHYQVPISEKHLQTNQDLWWCMSRWTLNSGYTACKQYIYMQNPKVFRMRKTQSQHLTFIKCLSVSYCVKSFRYIQTRCIELLVELQNCPMRLIYHAHFMSWEMVF